MTLIDAGLLTPIPYASKRPDGTRAKPLRFTLANLNEAAQRQIEAA